MAQRSWNTGEPLELVELPTPNVGTRDVRVRVESIGLNPADCQMLIAPPLRLLARLLGPKPPVVLGVDFAGEIEAVGSAVTDFRPGERVVGGTNFSRGQRGCFAETVVVRDDQICRIPDSVDLDTAVGLAIPGVTAHRTVVEHGHIGDEDFRDFVCTNPIRFYTRMNPRFFEGTRVEAEAAKIVEERKRRNEVTDKDWLRLIKQLGLG